MIDDYDSPWKEVLEHYFQAFLGFFFPEAHAEIDWSRGYESLDTELQQIVRDAELGKRLADKLMKVWRQDGEEQVVLVHIEVQGEYDAAFAERMFVYHYRLYDRYRKPIVSLAVLGDERPLWRPTHYRQALWGCQINLRFPVVKLLDYEQRWGELEASANPFAVVVMAHLKTRATRQDLEQRLQWKLQLVKRLYEKGYPREDILELFRFIDWLLTLPAAWEQRFTVQLSEYETAMSKPYITQLERHGIEKGLAQGLEQGMQQGLEQGLSAERALLVRLARRRFGETVAEQLNQYLAAIDDTDQLADIGEWIVACEQGTELLQQVQTLVDRGTSRHSS